LPDKSLAAHRTRTAIGAINRSFPRSRKFAKPLAEVEIFSDRLLDDKKRMFLDGLPSLRDDCAELVAPGLKRLHRPGSDIRDGPSGVRLREFVSGARDHLAVEQEFQSQPRFFIQARGRINDEEERHLCPRSRLDPFSKVGNDLSLLKAKRVVRVFHIRVYRVNAFDDCDTAHANALTGGRNDDHGAAGADLVRLAVVRRGFERITSGREMEVAYEDHIAALQRLQT